MHIHRTDRYHEDDPAGEWISQETNGGCALIDHIDHRGGRSYSLQVGLYTINLAYGFYFCETKQPVRLQEDLSLRSYDTDVRASRYRPPPGFGAGCHLVSVNAAAPCRSATHTAKPIVLP